MNYHIRKDAKGSKKNILIFILTIAITFFVILPFVVKANSSGEGSRENMFYVQVLNNGMSLIKATVFSEEDMAENSFSMEKSIFKFFNVNTSKPAALIGKEIACLNMQESGEDTDIPADIIFNPFKLNDKSVNVDNSSTENLPNKTVVVHDPKLKKKLNKSKPEVFIYHTHTTETYKPENKETLDETKNVCAVGDALASELENNYGISVIHDKTVHDATAYTQSYQRAGVTVDKYLKKYGNFKLIIDLHRDSVDKSAVTAKLNGENVAKFMFVMARKNPHFKNNMEHVNEMVKISDKLYPGFCRGVLYRNIGISYYNQNKSNNAVLIEWGSNNNTLDEAKNSAKYLARIIGEHLNGKK
ncbi:stage II sporulation protein P [Clostridium lundense]|uniref:stage II sporulation protein P n=1 Tax=Clostridium lundense TaxID=319475 RepID=UPI000687D6D2